MKNKKGFTLVELIAVIAILAVLVLVALPNVLGVFNKSIEEVMKIEETQATDAGSLYVRDHCGRTAKSKNDRSKCRNDVTTQKIEDKVYFCLSEIRKKGYIDEIKYKGNTKCDGIVLYDYDDEEVKFSEGKTYLICDNDLYVTPELKEKEEEVIKTYKEIINDCPNSSYEEAPEPEPNPNPEPNPTPTNSIYTVTLDNAGGTSTGNNQIYLKYGEGWYSDSEGINSIEVVNIPIKTGNEFKGYYTGENGTGTKVIDENGLIQAGEEKVFNTNETLYASWMASIYKLTLDNDGATTKGTEAIYEKYGIGWYSEQEGTNALTSIVVPVKKGYTFNGYSVNGVEIVKENGEINNNTTVINTDTETSASYTPRTYSVILNTGGADTPGTPAIYLKYNIGWYINYEATDSISKITVPKKLNHLFEGYYTGENGSETQVIDENGNIKSGQTTIFSNETNTGVLYAKYVTCKEGYVLVENKCIENPEPASWTIPGEYVYNIPITGYYKIELWGAQGGTGNSDGKPMDGGKGGYTSGEVYLTKGTVLNVFIGGKGSDGIANTSTGGTGGFNGGAKGGNDSSGDDDPAGGGGGASDIRIGGTAYSNRVIVAGGGGGGGPSHAGAGGNMFSGSSNSSGNLGIGQNGRNSTWPSGGGGGGYYGGASLQKDGGIGYGGTSYISNDFTNISIMVGNNSNNGKGKVSFIGEHQSSTDSDLYTNPGYYSFTASQNGYYKIELWGAKGGTGYRDGSAMTGGNGGYTSGEIYLESGKTIYAYVGEVGRNGYVYAHEGGYGGYNGGAKGGNDSGEDNDPAGGGGGASDIRIGGTSYTNRILIAGGGGGGCPNYIGGIGNLNQDSSNSSNKLGVGQDGRNSTWPSGGGGGGYYGGASVQSDGGLGFGGSSYVSKDFTNVSVIPGYNSNNNGKAQITYIGLSPTKNPTNNSYTTAGYYSFTAPQKGYYKIELWGAKGGIGYRDGSAMTGGNGGYTSGEIYLENGSTIYAYVGGQGNAAVSSRYVGGYGGFNGGAKGGTDTGDDNDPAGGGGGASDIRINGIDYSNRILVAGGGGGGSPTFTGGIGNLNQDSSNSSNKLGVGQDGRNSSWPSGGGGGGYYGGASVQSDGGLGFGGSSYVSKDFANVSVMPGYNSSNNGKVQITYIGLSSTKNPTNNTYTTAGYYSFTAPKKGYYKIELWGAQGGNGYSNANPISGGKGGYTFGEIYLETGTTIYAYVGGQGNDGVPSRFAGGYGGFNGGAKGGTDTGDDNDPAGGGGGASDIRINGIDYSNRILVAGGGGGGGPSLVGISGNSYSGSSNSSGKLGIGQDGRNSSWPSGGGGGGYYGGASVQKDGGVAYGGTYYISSDFVNTSVTAGNKAGVGKVQITWIGTTTP